MSDTVTTESANEVTQSSKANSAESAIWRDYYEITKPRVVALLVLTALVGMCLSVPGAIPWQILIPAMIGIGFLSSAAAAINHIVDERIDSIMGRTYNRPVATGRLDPRNATLFAIFLAVSGFAILFSFVNPLTAWLTFAGLVGYSFVYTMCVKRLPGNIAMF